MRRSSFATTLLLLATLLALVACGSSPTATSGPAPTGTTAARATTTGPAAPAAATAATAARATSTTVGAATPAAPATATRTTTVAGTATRTTTSAGTATRAASPAAGLVPRISGNLTVFAAASLTDAFNEMKASIERANPGTTITFNFAASSALRTQIEQGAKADVFVSADTVQLDNAKRSGVIAGDGSIFVRNTPVIIVPANNPRGITAPADIARPGVKLVLAAPEVPIGNYSRQIFDKMSRDPAYGADFSQRALANLASNEANVRQVVSKVQLGEGDAGIVYSSDVTPAVRAQLRVIPIPEATNVIADYPAAVVKGTSNEAGANAFIQYLLSTEGQSTLQKWGFIPVRAISRHDLGATRRDADNDRMWRRL
jgi:molybdate transport system substrate-binding protein